MSNSFAGTWTNRSFLNNPALVGNDQPNWKTSSLQKACWRCKTPSTLPS